MPIEHVAAHSVTKPWGIADPRPWVLPSCDGASIGELWFDRASETRTFPSLLLKLLFTSQPLSIQVHPDDAFDVILVPSGTIHSIGAGLVISEIQ
jgi:mannose-6-phosphate isomerase